MNHRSVPPRPVLLISGGSGFLGTAILRELNRENPLIDASEIRVFDLREPENPSHDSRIRYIKGDIRDHAALAAASEGVDAVLHLAAMVDWGTHRKETVYDINSGGTAGALAAAAGAGVSAFVYTSSLDAVITGKPLRHVDESLPYPRRHPNAYCGSKAEAEKLVAAADSPGGLRTVNLRPASVWGEGDPYHISALINLAKAGPYIRIGDGSAVQQLVYAGNLAYAHLLACRELLYGAKDSREPRCAGKSYFITDAPPENFFHFFDRIVQESGHPIRPENLWIPRGIMMMLGTAAEALAFATRPLVHWNPKVSRFAVNYTCSDFTFSSAAAERDFDFQPYYSHDDALELTIDWFRHNPTVNPPVLPATA